MQNEQALAGQELADQELEDPILAQVEQNVEKSVPPELKEIYDGIINAGMDIMADPKMLQYFHERMMKDDDIPKNTAEGVGALIGMIFDNTHFKTAPDDVKQQFMDAMQMAGISLMAHALDIAEKSGGIQLNEQIINEATSATTEVLLQMVGWDQEKLKGVMSKGA